MNRLSIHSIAQPRRRFLILVACVMSALLIGVYSFWSFRVWTDYKVSYERWYQDLRRHVDVASEAPSSTHEERAQKLTALRSVVASVNSAQGKLCSIHPTISWQHLMPDLKAREVKCGELLAGLNAFSIKLQAAVGYFEADQSLTHIFDTALKVQPSAEGTWESQVAVWHEAGESVKKLTIPGEFKLVQTKSASAMQGIETAWQAVVAANKVQDKSKYLEAQAKLTQSYEALVALGALSDRQLTLLASQVQQEYAKTFSLIM